MNKKILSIQIGDFKVVSAGGEEVLRAIISVEILKTNEAIITVPIVLVMYVGKKVAGQLVTLKKNISKLVNASKISTIAKAQLASPTRNSMHSLTHL